LAAGMIEEQVDIRIIPGSIAGYGAEQEKMLNAEPF
jgi:hypothetical protein